MMSDPFGTNTWFSLFSVSSLGMKKLPNRRLL